jgi:uncharacterized cofD-like protein
MKPMPNVVTIGGGTGTFVVLSGLKNYPIKLSAVVSMMDSGGSTGRLKDQLGVLPPGDLRQALVALSETEDVWRKLFTYRFDNGDLKGHNFGNIFLSALEKITGSTHESVEYAMRVLQTQGEVIPVTLDRSSLCAIYENGTNFCQESQIDEYAGKSKISKIFLKPNALINLDAKHAIERADYIIFGPGDLYTSILPNLLVQGMSEILANLNTKKIFITNLMTRAGQTDDYKVSDFVYKIEEYMGGETLDYILINSEPFSEEIIKTYKEVDNTIPVLDDLGGDTYHEAKVIRTSLLSNTVFKPSKSDTVKRSLLRHDSEKLAETLFKILSFR